MHGADEASSLDSTSNFQQAARVAARLRARYGGSDLHQPPWGQDDNVDEDNDAWDADAGDEEGQYFASDDAGSTVRAAETARAERRERQERGRAPRARLPVPSPDPETRLPPGEPEVPLSGLPPGPSDSPFSPPDLPEREGLPE